MLLLLCAQGESIDGKGLGIETERKKERKERERDDQLSEASITNEQKLNDQERA